MHVRVVLDRLQNTTRMIYVESNAVQSDIQSSIAINILQDRHRYFGFVGEKFLI